MLDAAYAAGIRYVDAARSYGRAEEFLAGWLAAHPEIDDVVVGSKWGYRYVGDWRMDAATHEVKDHSLAAFEEQWAQTPRAAGRAGRGLPRALGDAGQRRAGRRRGAPRAGRAARRRACGWGSRRRARGQADAVRRALEVTVDGEPLFTSFQSTWNVLEPSAGPGTGRGGGRRGTGDRQGGGGERAAGSGRRRHPRRAPGRGTGRRPGHDRGPARDRRGAGAAVGVAGAVGSGGPGPGGEQRRRRRRRPARRVAAELAGLAEDPPTYWAARSARPWT